MSDYLIGLGGIVLAVLVLLIAQDATGVDE